jgi:hypothetical protein
MLWDPRSVTFAVSIPTRLRALSMEVALRPGENTGGRSLAFACGGIALRPVRSLAERAPRPPCNSPG